MINYSTKPGARCALGPVLLMAALALAVPAGASLAETPREQKQNEQQSGQESPAYEPRSTGTSQQQERQDRVRPAPVRERAKPGESQQDARQRRNKDRALP